MVNFDVFINKALSASLSVDFQVICVLERLSLVEILGALVETRHGWLLRLLLVEDVQVRPMRGLYGDDKALFFRICGLFVVSVFWCG